MIGVFQFIKNLIFVALALGAAGTLVEATGIVYREAAKAHQHGGVSFNFKTVENNPCQGRCSKSRTPFLN